MLRAIDVAAYFLEKDGGRLFTSNVIRRNGRTFYDGNARLNKYLHIAQNLYIAKTGGALFADDMYAYDNGAVIPQVQENYMLLRNHRRQVILPDDVSTFLDQVYLVLENAPLEELIDISHEDEEWIKKHRYYAKDDQRMDSMAHAAEYKEQYADMLRVMERM